MPLPIAAKAGVIAISVAVAAAIAVYESPELRRLAEDVRRRIAIALHSLGDGVDPPNGGRSGQPRFNRPEDAEGFLQSRGVMGNDPGIEADEESRRRQREELMYWNSVREKKEREKKEAEEQAARGKTPVRGSTFDDFMRQDTSAERGTYVFNTGADVRNDDEGLVRRRGAECVRGLSASLYANPFADENGIDSDEVSGPDHDHISPSRDEIMSEATDIYNATEKDATASHTLSPSDSLPSLVRAEPIPMDEEPQQPPQQPERDPLLERELGPDEYMTAGQDEDEDQDQGQGEDQQDAYASIQAWAQASHPDFYSPLPVSPSGPLSEASSSSEAEVVTPGMLTPTDSASLAGSGEDVADEAASSHAYDVLSESEDGGMATPASWTEVGSTVSGSEDGVRHSAVHL